MDKSAQGIQSINRLEVRAVAGSHHSVSVHSKKRDLAGRQVLGAEHSGKATMIALSVEALHNQKSVVHRVELSAKLVW